GLNYLMLEGACRELEDVCEWTPPISKVMSVVREHKKLWKKRLQAQASIQRLSKDIAGLVAELGPKIEAAKVEAEVKRLEATLRRQRDRLIARQDENAQLTAALQYERRDYERTEASL